MAVVLPSVHSLTASAASESSLVNRDNRDASASSYSCQETAVSGPWVVLFVIPLASVSGVPRRVGSSPFSSCWYSSSWWTVAVRSGSGLSTRGGASFRGVAEGWSMDVVPRQDCVVASCSRGDGAALYGVV